MSLITHFLTQFLLLYVTIAGMKNLVIGIVILLLIGAGVFFYSKQKSTSSTPQPTAAMQISPTAMQETPTTGASPSAGAAMTGAVKTITITGTEFSFSPATITVNKGDKVKLTFTNGGQYSHNFSI